MKTLILAYDFPPYSSMGGQRPFGWYNYLNEFNIETTVVTRHWPKETKSKIDYCRSCGTATDTEVCGNAKIVRVPYYENQRDKLLVKHGFEKHNFLRQLLSLFFSIFQFIHNAFDNKYGIFSEADRLLKTESFDLIIATGEPFILFKYAHNLSQKHDVPWFADYRDCWSENYEIKQNGGFPKLLYKTLFYSLEKKYVKTAKHITTAAPIFKNELQDLFPDKNISVIYNGFVRENSLDVKNSIKKEKLTIGFAGSIYPFQPVEIFLEGFKIFTQNQNTPSIQAIFWGSDYSQEQSDRINMYSNELKNYVKTTPRLDKDTLFAEIQKADLLLILDNKGMISGKLYEYLLFNKRVLMAGRDHGAMEEILYNTNVGIICDSPEEIAQALEECYTEWEETGQVQCDSQNLEQYSRREQTKKLAELIHSILN